jgi:hypothetical protein
VRSALGTVTGTTLSVAAAGVANPASPGHAAVSAGLVVGVLAIVLFGSGVVVRHRRAPRSPRAGAE